jgi:flagellar biogenesis protein FliO
MDIYILLAILLAVWLLLRMQGKKQKNRMRDRDKK